MLLFVGLDVLDIVVIVALGLLVLFFLKFCVRGGGELGFGCSIAGRRSWSGQSCKSPAPALVEGVLKVFYEGVKAEL